VSGAGAGGRDCDAQWEGSWGRLEEKVDSEPYVIESLASTPRWLDSKKQMINCPRYLR
jgi:hypothetical protein